MGRTGKPRVSEANKQMRNARESEVHVFPEHTRKEEESASTTIPIIIGTLLTRSTMEAPKALPEQSEEPRVYVCGVQRARENSSPVATGDYVYPSLSIAHTHISPPQLTQTRSSGMLPRLLLLCARTHSLTRSLSLSPLFLSLALTCPRARERILLSFAHTGGRGRPESTEQSSSAHQNFARTPSRVHPHRRAAHYTLLSLSLVLLSLYLYISCPYIHWWCVCISGSWGLACGPGRRRRHARSQQQHDDARERASSCTLRACTHVHHTNTCGKGWGAQRAHFSLSHRRSSSRPERRAAILRP